MRHTGDKNAQSQRRRRFKGAFYVFF
jgi:hypothetical protein